MRGLGGFRRAEVIISLVVLMVACLVFTLAVSGALKLYEQGDSLNETQAAAERIMAESETDSSSVMETDGQAIFSWADSEIETAGVYKEITLDGVTYRLFVPNTADSE